jgi:hypothetical protein
MHYQSQLKKEKTEPQLLHQVQFRGVLGSTVLHRFLSGTCFVWQRTAVRHEGNQLLGLCDIAIR